MRALSHAGSVITAALVSLLIILSSVALIIGDQPPQRKHYSMQEVRSLLVSDLSPEQLKTLSSYLKSQNEWWSILLSQEIESSPNRDLVAVLDSIENKVVSPPTSIQITPGAGPLFSN